MSEIVMNSLSIPGNDRMELAPQVKIMAAGSLAAGIGLFVLSMIAVLAIGFFTGALVLTERIVHHCIGDECSEENESENESVRLPMVTASEAA